MTTIRYGEYEKPVRSTTGGTRRYDEVYLSPMSMKTNNWQMIATVKMIYIVHDAIAATPKVSVLDSLVVTIFSFDRDI
jgi:hypothetical protein